MAISLCRACLSQKERGDVYDWYSPVGDLNEPLTYQECFQICTQLDVEKADSSSSYVKDVHFLCKDCVQELLNSYRFLRKAQKSAHELYYLSQKDEGDPCDVETNSFEWVNIQNVYKGVEAKDSTQVSEHTVLGGVIKGTEDISIMPNIKDTEKLEMVKIDVDESQNPLLPPVYKSPTNHDDLRDSVETGTHEKENSKPEKTLKLNVFECDTDVKEEMVEDTEYEASAPLIDTVSSHETEKPEQIASSVDCKNAKLKKTSKSKTKVKGSAVQKVRSKGKRAKNCDKEYKQTPCEYCKKLFPENKLKQHQSRYHRPKVFLCDICPSAFSIANNLRRHQRTHDSNRERNFTCAECGRKFFTEDVYRTHIKIHQSTRQPQFKCTECDKVFMHKGSLTLHIEKHTGPKNECNICKKRYVRKIDLEVHMRNHSGDLPYQCSKCGKAFMTTSALRKHELLHSGIRFKCDICNKEYSHPSKLSRHRLDHTGLPLKCAICNKGFAEPNKIRRHIGSVHKVEDTAQVNNLIIRVSKHDNNSTKGNSN